jgi:hypothetical protein
MTNARFAREPLAGFFTGWSKIRVALLMQMTDAGVNLTGTPRFAVGLCSGSSDIIGDASTTHFVGAITNGSEFTRETTPARYAGSNSLRAAKRVGTTLTVGGAAASTFRFHTTAPQMFFVDITAGSPNYGVQIFYYTSATAPVVTHSDFLTQSLIGTPSFTNHGYLASQAVAVNEGTDGVLDHGCVWWDQAASNMQILSWRMYRLA